MNDDTLQPTIMCRKGDVAKYVLLPGDPGRVERIATLLDNAREVASNREYKIYTGEYDGIPVSICSTGIGGPSTAIAIQELINIGAENFVRIGSCGSNYEGVKVGDFIISEGVVREDHTALDFVPLQYPAMADRYVTFALERASLQQDKQKAHVGVTMCIDGLYSKKNLERKDFWHDFRVLAQEMEAGTVFPLSKINGKRAGAVFLVVNKLGEKDLQHGIREYAQRIDEEGWDLTEAEENMIKVVLESIKIMDREYHV